MIRNAWYVAGFSHEFQTGVLQAHTVVNRPLVMWRTNDGGITAFDARCSHKRFPLWDGKLLDGDILECAYHGFCYDSKGECVSIPAQATGGTPGKASKTLAPVVEQDGVVWVWPGDPDRCTDRAVPSAPEIGTDAWDTRTSEPMPVPANYRLLIENLLDITHFYPLHDGNIGDITNSYIPVELERKVVGGNPSVMTTRQASDYQLPPMMSDWFGLDIADRIHTHQMIGPSLTRVELRLAPPGQLGTDQERGYVIYHTHTPVDGSNHIWRWAMNCRAGSRYAADRSKSMVDRVIEGFPGVVEQDRWALEKQQEMFDRYEDDGYKEVHIKTDGAVVMLRRELAELAAEEAAGVPVNGDRAEHKAATAR